MNETLPDPYEERVDILDPNTYASTGIAVTRREAHLNGHWIGSFNLWIVRRTPAPALLYQQRDLHAPWAPGKLDASAGGHYQAGEGVEDGLREVREELGKDYRFADLVSLGKKIYMRDDGPYRLRYIVDVFFVEDNADLSAFHPDPHELQGLFVCPLDELLRLHAGALEEFTAHGVERSDGGWREGYCRVRRDSFPFNPDDYHRKIALLARRFLDGDPYLVY